MHHQLRPTSAPAASGAAASAAADGRLGLVSRSGGVAANRDLVLVVAEEPSADLGTMLGRGGR